MLKIIKQGNGNYSWEITVDDSLSLDEVLELMAWCEKNIPNVKKPIKAKSVKWTKR